MSAQDHPPVTGAELERIEQLALGLNGRSGLVQKGARIEFTELGPTLLLRLAAELRAIENALGEAGISRRSPDEPVRSIVARLIADANEEDEKLAEAEAELERLTRQRDVALAAVDMAEALAGREADESVIFAPRAAAADNRVVPLTIGAGKPPAGATLIEAEGEAYQLLLALFGSVPVRDCTWVLPGREWREIPGGRTSRGIDVATLRSHGLWQEQASQ